MTIESDICSISVSSMIRLRRFTTIEVRSNVSKQITRI
jgi:hypothetical protein